MRTLATAFRMLLFITVLTGIAYPLLVTGIARLFFPYQANGSLIIKENKPVGSELIGQSFDSSAFYFTSRPSAISYNPLPSGGSNYGLTNRKLTDEFDRRRRRFISWNELSEQDRIPSEMLFASASGLDPHISPDAAIIQARRIIRARHFSEAQGTKLQDLIGRLTEPPQFLCLGEKRINVLLLNLETDKIK
jgi:potassium-transporting ATPase KdpC subunit